MIPAYLPPLANHLWQSTIFAALVLLIAPALRRNRAQARYWLWLAASLKFLVPFSLLIGLGNRVDWRTAFAVAPPVSQAIEQIGRPFSVPEFTPLAMATAAAPAVWPTVLTMIWLAGCFVVLATWWTRWRRIRAAVRAGTLLPLDAPIPVLSSPTLLEPGVFGIFHPVLLLPEGIAGHLTPAQLEAILAHEMCHVRRRDNLAAALQMLVESVFWFHPLVWWIGVRLVDERERACDEEVLRLGNEPRVYAEGILNVCKFYLKSPLPCASGVTGSDLKKRIETIMTNRMYQQLTFARKLLLTVAGISAVAGPIVIGILGAPGSRAQTQAADPRKFEVASIKPASPDEQNVRINFVPGGGLNVVNAGLRELITMAYNVRPFQLSGGPAWLRSERYDIVAKAPEGATPLPENPRDMTDEQRQALQELMRARVRALLEERFLLAIHKESKEMPVYGLELGRNGHKLKAFEGEGGGRMRMGRGQLQADGASIQMLTNALSNATGRKVIDKTGLTGTFDINLTWTPDPGAGAFGPGGPPGGPQGGAPTADLSGPSIFTAIHEQLGLKLESARGPVEIIVVDRAEKPSAN